MLIMNSPLKTDLESLVLDFKCSLEQIKFKDFNNYLLFADKCQDLLNLYRNKMLNSVRLLCCQSNPEFFLEEYMPSLKYHSECQHLLEKYLEASVL